MKPLLLFLVTSHHVSYLLNSGRSRGGRDPTRAGGTGESAGGEEGGWVR